MTFLSNINAQDIENVVKADSVSKAFVNKVLTSPLELNGQLNARSMFYAGTDNSDPFIWMLNGSMSVKFMEYSMPLAFTYTNKGIQYSASSPLKFNRFKLSPHYKWVQLYLGSSSLNYSPYTLGGAQFRGAGVELTPSGAFSGGLMYGRFYDAVSYNEDNPYVTPVFKRTGYALNLNYNKDRFKIEASFLNASDDPSSIVVPPDSILKMKAMQNISMAFKSKFNPVDKVNLNIEYATSHLNSSLLSTKEDFFNMLLANTVGVSKYNAYKLDINFNPGVLSFGGSIEHIDPEYVTLGAYYSRNDFQNVTLNIAGNVLNNKVNFVLNGGLENDNLKSQKQRKNTRTVGSAVVNYMPSDKLSATLNYSNFQSFSNIKSQFDYINEQTPFENIDTLNYLQVNQNASVNFMYRLKATEQNVQALKLICNLNQTDAANGNNEFTGSTIVNVNGIWSSSYLPQKTNIAAGINSTFLQNLNTKTLTWGPAITVSSTLMDELLKLSLSVAYNQSKLNNEFNRSNFNIKGAAEYTYRDIHKFKLEYTVFMKRYSKKDPQNDYRITLSYILAFKKKEIYFNKNHVAIPNN